MYMIHGIKQTYDHKPACTLDNDKKSPHVIAQSTTTQGADKKRKPKNIDAGII